MEATSLCRSSASRYGRMIREEDTGVQLATATILGISMAKVDRIFFDYYRYTCFVRETKAHTAVGQAGSTERYGLRMATHCGYVFNSGIFAVRPRRFRDIIVHTNVNRTLLK